MNTLDIIGSHQRNIMTFITELLDQHLPITVEFSAISDLTQQLANNEILANKLREHDLRDLVTEGITAIVRKRPTGFSRQTQVSWLDRSNNQIMCNYQ